MRFRDLCARTFPGQSCPPASLSVLLSAVRPAPERACAADRCALRSGRLPLLAAPSARRAQRRPGPTAAGRAWGKAGGLAGKRDAATETGSAPACPGVNFGLICSVSSPPETQRAQRPSRASGRAQSRLSRAATRTPTPTTPGPRPGPGEGDRTGSLQRAAKKGLQKRARLRCCQNRYRRSPARLLAFFFLHQLNQVALWVIRIGQILGVLVKLPSIPVWARLPWTLGFSYLVGFLALSLPDCAGLSFTSLSLSLPICELGVYYKRKGGPGAQGKHLAL